MSRELKWIVAYKCSEFQAWQEYFECDDLHIAVDAMHLCAKSDNRREMICVFGNHPGWTENAVPPRYSIDRRDKSNWPIIGLGNLFGAVQGGVL